MCTARLTCVQTAMLLMMVRWQVASAVSRVVLEDGNSVWTEISSQAKTFRGSSIHAHRRARHKHQRWHYRPPTLDCKRQLDKLLETLDTVANSQNPSCRHDSTLPTAIPKGKYLIGLNLHNSQQVLPHIMIQLIHLFLGVPPETGVFVSIYESGSTDETVRLLSAFKDILRGLRVPHQILAGSPDKINFGGKKRHRIAFLASMRNRVLEPLWRVQSRTREPNLSSHVSIAEDVIGDQEEQEQLTDDQLQQEEAIPRKLKQLDLQFEPQHSQMTSVFELPVEGFPADKVIFINDVYVCTQDIIRLASHSADIACATDYNVFDHFIKLYDTWVIRDVTGVAPAEKPPYFSHAYTSARLNAGLPSPMYSCWNGMVVLNAMPFRNGLKVRSHAQGECASSECTLLADDFWRLNYTRVLMDPGIRLAYSNTLFSKFGKLFDQGVMGYMPVTTWEQVLGSPIDWSISQRPKSRTCCDISPHDNVVQYHKCTNSFDPFKVNYTDMALKSNYRPTWVSFAFPS